MAFAAGLGYRPTAPGPLVSGDGTTRYLVNWNGASWLVPLTRVKASFWHVPAKPLSVCQV
jgi:hypothetical protein